MVAASFHVWLPGSLEFCIQSVPLLFHFGRLHEVKIEQQFKNIEIPFGLTRLNFKYFAGSLRFDRMCREIPDVANRIQ